MAHTLAKRYYSCHRDSELGIPPAPAPNEIIVCLKTMM